MAFELPEFEIPKTCGVDLNLNNLKGELQARAQAMLNIDLGTPAGLQAMADNIEGELNILKDKVSASLPEVPEEIKSLRGDLADLATTTKGSLAYIEKTAALALNYAGIKNLRGFTNINITDLASSVFSVTGTFDPCSMTIPNISLDPSGALKKLPVQPLLGKLETAKDTKQIQKVTNSVKEAFKDNAEVLMSDPPITKLKKIQENVSPAPVSTIPETIELTPAGQDYSLSDPDRWDKRIEKGIDTDKLIDVTIEGGLKTTFLGVQTGTKAWNGQVPSEWMSWPPEDMNKFIRDMDTANDRGLLTADMYLRAIALGKINAEKLRLWNLERVAKYRAEHPEFDDPSSPNYYMYKGVLLKEGPNKWNEKPDWIRA